MNIKIPFKQIKDTFFNFYELQDKYKVLLKDKEEVRKKSSNVYDFSSIISDNELFSEDSLYSPDEAEDEVEDEVEDEDERKYREQLNDYITQREQQDKLVELDGYRKRIEISLDEIKKKEIFIKSLEESIKRKEKELDKYPGSKKIEKRLSRLKSSLEIEYYNLNASKRELEIVQNYVEEKEKEYFTVKNFRSEKKRIFGYSEKDKENTAKIFNQKTRIKHYYQDIIYFNEDDI